MSEMDPFLKAQKMLSKASCPSCSGKKLELRLSCEMGSGCVYRAQCQECNVDFQVRSGEAPKIVADLLPNLSCPDCGNKGADFGMVCELDTRVCDPVVSCSSCGKIYQKAA